MRQTSVKKSSNGLTINFQGDFAKENVQAMVERCQTGGCDCMSEENKTKIKMMKVDGVDGDVKIHLEGEAINMKDIEASVEKCDC